MKSKLFVLLLLGGIVPVCALRSETADSLRNGKTYPIGEVVVTGTRLETDVRASADDHFRRRNGRRSPRDSSRRCCRR